MIKDTFFDNHDEDEIVGILYDNKFISNEEDVATIIKLKLPFYPISRDMCRLASRFDLGDSWIERAKLPILFRLDWGEYLRGGRFNQALSQVNTTV